MKPLVWSYSFLSTYLRCRLQAEARYVTRTYPYKESPEMKFGNDVHKAAEHYIKGVLKPEDIEKNYAAYKPLFDKAKAMRGISAAEHEMGLTREWRQTGFKASDVWGRCKIDFYVINGDSAVILDWKTGKIWEDPFELEIQALFLSIFYPAVKNIAGMYVWLKDGKFGDVYNLGPTIYETQKKIENIMSRINMEVWHASKNALCGWCEHSHCKFYKETRRRS